MNILIINHYAGAPSIGMEYRHHCLAYEWQKYGHKVLIVCASYTHLRSKQFKIKGNFENHIVDGVNYLVLKTSEYKENNTKRFINILTFVWRLYNQTKKLANEFQPDVIVSSSTFLFEIYSAKRIAKISGAKIVLEVKDLWPLSIVELGGYSKWHPIIMIMQRTENYAYKYSDKVISLLPKAMEYMVEHGMDSKKFIYIPNGIAVDEWKTDIEIPNCVMELIQKIKTQKKKIIGYAGNHGIANALVSLVEAMKILEEENVALFLIGKGQEKERLVKHTKELELHNVYFIPAVPKAFIPSILDKLDILYIGLQNQPVFRFGISPNKLMDYMMIGKPIIQAISSGNDIVKEAECGITIEPENPIAVAEAVKYLISLPDADLKFMGKKGTEYCIKNHDYKILAKKFLEVLE